MHQPKRDRNSKLLQTRLKLEVVGLRQQLWVETKSLLLSLKDCGCPWKPRVVGSIWEGGEVLTTVGQLDGSGWLRPNYECKVLSDHGSVIA